jgi:hypothetical protein
MTTGGGPPRTYATTPALRAALEARLMAQAQAQAIEVGRLHRQVAFERILVRRAADLPAADCSWVLKGGLALTADGWTFMGDIV